MKNIRFFKKKIINITTLSAFLFGLFLIIVSILGWTMISYLDFQGRTKSVEALEAVLNSVQKAVHIWFTEHQNDVGSMAASPDFISSVKEQLKRKEQNHSLPKSPASLQMKEIISDDLHFHEYESFFVVSADFITLGALDEREIGKKTRLIIQKVDILKQVFEGKTLFIPPFFTENPAGHPERNNTGIFIASPIKDADRLLPAILLVGIDVEGAFSQLALSGRIGKTGETYFFDKKGRLISQSRFDSELLRAGLIEPGEGSVLNIEIRDPGGPLLEDFKPDLSQEKLPLTFMAASAIRGENSKSIEAYNDYRGVKVLGAWLWDKQLGIGMASEIDEREVIESVSRTAFIFVWILGSCVLFSLLLMFILILIRRKDKELLVKSEIKYRTLFESSQDAILILDPQKGYIDCNNAALKIFGAEKGSDILQFYPAGLSPEYQKAGVSSAKKSAELITESLEEGTISFDWTHKRLAGDEFPATVWLTPFILDKHLVLQNTIRDITEQVKADRALRKSESRLSEAQGIAHLGNWDWDITAGSLYWSDEIYRIFGLKPQEFEATYEAFLQTIHPQDREKVQNAVNICLQDNTPYNIEHRIVLPDRTERFVHEQAEVFCDDTGRPVRMAGTVQDITDRKKAEKDLQHYREHLEELVSKRTEEIRILSRVVEQSPNTVIITDKEGYFQFVNPAFIETTGYSLNDVMGKTPSILKSNKMNDAVYEDLWSTIRNNKIWKGELLNKKKNGQLYWDSATISAVKDNNGQISHYVGIQENVTERKELEDNLKASEERYRALFEQAGDSILLLDIETNQIVEFNDLACKNLGYTRAEFETLNIPDFDLKGSSEIIGERLQRVLDKGYDSYETKHQRKNKTIRNVMVNNRLISIDGKDYIQAIWRDITELKTLEGELRLAKEKAEASAKAKSSFLANMSHEIRTPMNSIIGFIELSLEKNQLTNSSRDFLSTARNSAVSLLALLNDILDVSKLDAGKLKIETKRFHLARLLQQTFQTLAFSAREKGLELSLNMSPALPPCILGDPNRLRQVLINLMGNAVKFTEKGFVTVSVEKNEQELHFSIKDSGIGMTPGQLEKVFQPFTQADQSIARRFGGTGLGTTIAHQLVTLMGGTIWVESESKKGSNFSFTIPLSVPYCVEKCDPLCIEHKDPGERAISQPARSFDILLAEDIEENAKLAKIRLTGQHHKVHIVKNGLEAVETFKEKPFDLILMDVQMPVMDGLDAARQIRRYEAAAGRSEPVPIIALTASVMEEERRKCLEAGIDRVVEKPILFDHLFEVMENLVPDGVGLPVTTFSLHLEAPDRWLLPEDLSGIDVKKGLRLWQYKDDYINALKSFAVKFGDVVLRLKKLVEDKQTEDAGSLSHALKGVSANLSIIEVSKLAAEINKNLEINNTEDVLKLLFSLENEMNLVLSSIQRIKGAGKKESVVSDGLNLQRIYELIEKLSLLFSRGELNKELFSELSLLLTGHIDDELLNGLENSVNNYNFKKAIEHLGAISSLLAGREK